MSETWYRVEGYGKLTITPLEVERATDKCVFVRDAVLYGSSRSDRVSRHDKSSDYNNWFATEAAAVAFVRGQLESRVRYAEDKVTEAQRALAAFEQKYGKESTNV